MELREKEMLMDFAREARKKSYSPYSKYSVGAALLCKDGKIYCGCNVENASYGATCCAERVAVFSAIADGEKEFSAIAIVGNDSPCMPCGICRQVLSELCTDELEVLVCDKEGSTNAFLLGELLPGSFKLDN